MQVIYNTPLELTVVRRNGEHTPLNPEKIKKVVEWAVDGLNLNPCELEAKFSLSLRDEISTKEIQEALINASKELTSPEESNWRYVTGRLRIWAMWKEAIAERGTETAYSPESFCRLVQELGSKRIYKKELLNYTAEELETAGSWINPLWDLDYDDAGAYLLKHRYLADRELPQEMFLANALVLAQLITRTGRLHVAWRIYEALGSRKLSLATPMLYGLRLTGKSLTSCFILKPEDSLEGIMEYAVTKTARISREGGGVGMDLSAIRAAGSTVQGRQGASGGIVPWIKILNDTILAVNQGGRRIGGLTIALRCWHLDICEFLELQTEHGDQRKKAYDIMPQVVLHDEFMQRVQKNEDWTLVDPYEVKVKMGYELDKLNNHEFVTAYNQIERAIAQKELKLFQKIKARDLFLKILKVKLEKGVPYITFIDTINRANPNPHKGQIPSVNLCVAADTKILTSSGYRKISECYGEGVSLWNGSEWSPCEIKFTGANKSLTRIVFSNHLFVDVTPNHVFYLNVNGETVKTSAFDLKVGDRLIDFSYPQKDKNYLNARDVDTVNKFKKVFNNRDYAYIDRKQGLVAYLPTEYDLIEWKLRLSEIGIIASIAPYQRKLTISLNDCKKLQELKAISVLFDFEEPREINEPVVVQEIIPNFRIADTYCFNEPKKHLGIFNGIIAGNCTESFSNVDTNHVHCCNLISLNLAQCNDLAEITYLSRLATRILDYTIDATTTPFPEAKAHNHLYRTIGVGTMGLADYLAKNEKHYTDLDFIESIYEAIAFGAVSESVDLAIARGCYPAFVGSQWEKGYFNGRKWEEVANRAGVLNDREAEWLQLREDIKIYGIRNSHLLAIAPNSSTGLLLGSSLSVLPPHKWFYYTNISKGAFFVAPPFINECQWFYPENYRFDQQKLIDAIAVIQPWIDTGISTDLIINLYPNGDNVPINGQYIYDLVLYAWRKQLKTIYYMSSVERKTANECTSCAN